MTSSPSPGQSVCATIGGATERLSISRLRPPRDTSTARLKIVGFLAERGALPGVTLQRVRSCRPYIGPYVLGMKRDTNNAPARARRYRTSRMSLLVCGAAWVAACGSEALQLNAGSQVPAAKGTVDTSTDDNNNLKLDIRVKHLAPAQNVSDDATTYVVWVEPMRGGAARKLGALEVGDDRQGRLRAKTTSEPMQLFVTAEPSSQVSEPSTERILWANIE
jgi:hypothetical protein